MAEIKLKIKVRKDTTANLQAMTTVLENGEVAYSTNDHVLKVGDGTKAWNSLPNLFSSNADTLDNHDSDYFLNTSATAQTKSGNLTVNGLGLGHGNELWTNHGEKRIFINYRGANETVYDSSSTEQVVLDIGHGHGEDKLARFANDAITLYRNVVIPYNSSIGVNNKIFSNDAGELIISTDHDYNTFRTSNATYGIKGASGHIYDLASLDPTNCYWANVKVSATSSNETIPTFKSIIVSAPSSADVSAANIANLPSLKFVPEEAAQWGALVWSDYDAYQSPAALTLVGNQGSEYLIAPNIKATTNFYGHNIYLGYTNPTTFVSGQGIYWNPYVESTSDPSDAASITVIANGTAGGTELRIQQANDSTDIINLISPAFIYLNSKKAFSINDSWLRINEDSGFSSGVYFGNSIIRSDRIIQGGTENFGLKIQSLQGGGTGWSEGIYVVETNAGSGYSTITAGSSDKNNLISLVNNTNGTQYLEVKTKHSGDSSATQRSFWWPSTGGIVATQEWISTTYLSKSDASSTYLTKSVANMLHLGAYDTYSTDANGNFVVVRKTGYIIVDNSNTHLLWISPNSGNAEFYCNVKDINTSANNVLADRLKTTTAGYIYTNNGDFIALASDFNSVPSFFISFKDCTTEALARAKLNTPVYCQYELATSYTETYEPSHFARTGQSYIEEWKKSEADRGANLLPTSLVINTISSAGNVVPLSNLSLEAGTYTIQLFYDSLGTSSNIAYELFLYDASGNKIIDFGTPTGTIAKSHTWTQNVATTQIKIFTAIAITNARFMLIKGSTPLPYQAYEGSVVHEKGLAEKLSAYPTSQSASATYLSKADASSFLTDSMWMSGYGYQASSGRVMSLNINGTYTMICFGRFRAQGDNSGYQVLFAIHDGKISEFLGCPSIVVTMADDSSSTNVTGTAWRNSGSIRCLQNRYGMVTGSTQNEHITGFYFDAGNSEPHWYNYIAIGRPMFI